MVQFIYLDALVMLSFMFARFGSKLNGFLEIFIYIELRDMSLLKKIIPPHIYFKGTRRDLCCYIGSYLFPMLPLHKCMHVIFLLTTDFLSIIISFAI
jgi:hypothetical protein